MMHLEYEDTFAALKKGADSGYFEGLIRTYLLDNPYEAVVIASPKKNLTARIEDVYKRQRRQRWMIWRSFPTKILRVFRERAEWHSREN